MKPKTCKSCKQKFQPVRPLQSCCGIPCAIAHANNLKAKNNALEAKKTRKAYKDTKEKLKSLTDHLREAQTVFNSWIRERDKHLPCVSCGMVGNCQWHAGHFRTTKAAPQLRFNEDNCWKQCAQCNNHLSGNVTEYRIELVKRIGLERVEALENNNDLHRYTIDEAKVIKAKYKAKLKELKNLQ